MLPTPLCDKEFEEMLKECQPGEVERTVDGITLPPAVAHKYSAKTFAAVSLSSRLRWEIIISLANVVLGLLTLLHLLLSLAIVIASL